MSATEATGRTHLCPGRCGRDIPQHLLACRDDWRALPYGIRERVTTAYEHRLRHPDRHRAALVAALTWFRENRNRLVTAALHEHINRPAR